MVNRSKLAENKRYKLKYLFFSHLSPRVKQTTAIMESQQKHIDIAERYKSFTWSQGMYSNMCYTASPSHQCSLNT